MLYEVITAVLAPDPEQRNPELVAGQRDAAAEEAVAGSGAQRQSQQHTGDVLQHSYNFV